ncbi:SDR family oxidoreductase [Pseudonocardia sp. C8]|uniref:SDR family NAD(P)-dependent oxidoreductase n=1 Tax=Pseudonocardia sp. C8 TaxID=2762759 RepID=UPI001642ECA9|nr:SDR family oxidoreductase [Pseudonocardia sp. C8]MBC3190146.1 SDR family oxidoreductase [Pseudonocardia sp. C8]
MSTEERAHRALAGSRAPEVVLITGGARGIGAAVVRRCVRLGMSVCFTYVDAAEAAADLVAQIGEPERVCAVRTDATDLDGMEAVFDRADAMGRVTALVNNAAVTYPLGDLARSRPEDIRRAIEVDLVAPVLLCRLAVRRWQPDPSGRSIVNVSSVAASSGAPHEYVAYAAAKAGVEALTVGLAKEVAPLGVRVNAVAPGTTATGIHARSGDPDRPARIAGRIPMGRVAEPDEIAAVISWLLGPDASYVTGAVVPATGGS